MKISEDFNLLWKAIDFFFFLQHTYPNNHKEGGKSFNLKDLLHCLKVREGEL